MKKRVVVTGMGLVSCFGNDVDLFYDKLLAGDSGVSHIKGFPCDDYSTKIAAEIKDFDAGGYIDKKQARRIDDYIAYIMVAGKKALEYGGIDLEALNKKRCGIVIGSGMGGMSTFAKGVETLNNKGVNRVSPFFVPYILSNMGGGLLGIDIGFMGPNYSISTACATANYCIISAADHIIAGDADLMLCGGGEAAICPIGVGGFIACKALSQGNDTPEKASRPWDKGRDGFVMGEGAGVLVLESLDHAKARGATIFAEYLGGAMSCDAYHMTNPRSDGEGAIMSMNGALERAQMTPGDINYINAHATSTVAGDLAEAHAMKNLFDANKSLHINSTKSMIGHCLAAAAGIEAIATIKAITTGVMHPTINLEDPEPDIAGFGISDTAEKVSITAAMSNSFGFGGHNASVIFAPYTG